MGSNPCFLFGLGSENVGQGWNWMMTMPTTSYAPRSSELVGRVGEAAVSPSSLLVILVLIFLILPLSSLIKKWLEFKASE